MRRVAFWWGFLAGVVVCFLAVGGYLGIHSINGKIREMRCMKTLIQANWLFVEYQEQHSGGFPRHLGEFKGSKTGLDQYGCPDASTSGVASYTYLRPVEGASGDAPVLFCWRHSELLALTKGGAVRRWAR